MKRKDVCKNLPTVVPTEVGIAEEVEDGKNGYKIDVSELYKIEQCIDSMLTDEKLYDRLSANALTQSKKYDMDAMVNSIIKLL